PGALPQAEHGGTDVLLQILPRRPLRAVQELQAGTGVLLGQPVDAVDQHLGQPGEELDQSDAGIGRIVVRPLRREAGDQRPGLVEEAGVAAVVQGGLRDAHARLPEVASSVLPERAMSWLPEKTRNRPARAPPSRGVSVTSRRLTWSTPGVSSIRA